MRRLTHGHNGEDNAKAAHEHVSNPLILHAQHTLSY